MAIKVVAAPKEALKLIQTGIDQHLVAGFVDAGLSAVTGLASPHRIFHLGLDPLVGEKPIAKTAKHVGWSALLLDRGKRSVAAAELAVTRTGLRFACVTRGPHAAGAGDAEAVAQRWSKRAAKLDYELALLRIPGAYCTALWLRASDPNGDAFVPIAPCPPSLEPNKTYTEADLRGALIPEARKQLEAPDEGGTKR